MSTLTDNWWTYAQKGARNRLVVKLSASPCPQCSRKLSEFVFQRRRMCQATGGDFELDLQVASIYKQKRTGEVAEDSLRGLEKLYVQPGVTLTAWDVVEELEEKGVNAKGLMQDRPDMFEALQERVAGAKQVVDDLASRLTAVQA